jgi:hypothetical protein
MAELCVELFDSGAKFGPGTRLCELWHSRNVGWSSYDRVAGKGFLTLAQNDSALAYCIPMTTHIRMTRVGTNNVTVYEGVLSEPASTEDDVVWSAEDYLSLLALSRSGYRTLYPEKLLGSEIIAAEWALAKNATSSPLGFVFTGTIEDPLGDDNATPIKTDTQFGTLDQNRLRLFYDLAEMGRANTDNHVSFGISRDTHAFTFLGNQGTTRGFGLDLNGRVVSYTHVPNWAAYRNDLATIAQDPDGGAEEVIVKDDAAAAVKGRRQDLFAIQTLLGLADATTETGQQAAAAARQLHRGLNPIPALQLQLLEGSLDPLDGWDVGDKAPVSIVNGVDNIAANWRIVGIQGKKDAIGEHLTVFVIP